MYDAMATLWNTQLIAIRAAMSMTARLVELQVMALEQQLGLWDHVHAHRRATDPEMHINPKARKRRKALNRDTLCGPKLHDHYGHRAQDVDVEHL